MRPADLVDAIIEEVRHWVVENRTPDTFLATWTAVDSGDANLSTLTLPDGSTLRGVPKLSSASSLSAGDVVLCSNSGSNLPVIILGEVVGDISAYGG